MSLSITAEAIPFVDLVANTNTISGEVDAAIQRVVSSGSWILGPNVERFEREFARYVGVEYCVGVGNGLDALRLALMALGIGQGADVILPANTFIATALAVSSVGARPILVDVDEHTFNLAPQAIDLAITSSTKLILPVHLTGQPADMDAIRQVAVRHSLPIVEDSAQAHGARYKGQCCGSMSNVGCFSFYPSKNLGAIGDGGAITTNDEGLAAQIRLLRNYGQRVKYEHVVAGVNSRLDALQAAVLTVKLAHLDRWNRLRAAAATSYREELREVGDIQFQAEMPDSTHVYHLFMILTKHRDSLLQHLRRQGIQCGIHYPIPIHLQAAYCNLGYKRGDFPITERLADTMLSLPMYPELRIDQIKRVVVAVKAFFETVGAGV